MDASAHTPLGQTALDLVHHLTQTVACLGNQRRGGIEHTGGTTTFHTRKAYSVERLDLEAAGAHLSGHARLALAQSKEATQAAFRAFQATWASHRALESCTWQALDQPPHRPRLGILVEPQTKRPTRVWLHLGAMPYGDQTDSVSLQEAVAALDAAWNAAQTETPGDKVGHHALEDLGKQARSKTTTWEGPVVGTRSVWQKLAPFWVGGDLLGASLCRVWSRNGTLQKPTAQQHTPDAQALALDGMWWELCKALWDAQVEDALFVVGRDRKALLHIGSVEWPVQNMARRFLEAVVAWRPALASSVAVACERGGAVLKVFGGQTARPSHLTGVSDLVCEGPLWMITSMHHTGTCWMHAPFATRAMAEQAAAMLEPSSVHTSAVHLVWSAY